MHSLTTAIPFSSSLAAVLGTFLLAGCSPKPPARGTSILLYCTQPAKPFANNIRARIEEISGRPVVLAPMSGKDLLAGLQGTRAGDFAVVISPSLRDKLAAGGWVGETTVWRRLTPCLVSKRALTVDELETEHLRLGSGKAGQALGDAVTASLPESLRAAVAKKIVHRSERSDELLRLLDLGGLDAVFVWDQPPPPETFPTQKLETPKGKRDVVIIALTCSRLPSSERQRLLDQCPTGTNSPSTERETVP